MDWSLAPEDFELDGSLRDIYFLGMSSNDCDRFLAIVRAGSLPFRFTVGGEEVAMPESFQEIHQIWKRASASLAIDPDGLGITCYFFSDDDIELDFWPQTFVSFDDGDFVYADYIAKVGALSAFIAHLGRMLGKTVIVTPESQPKYPIWQYEPTEDRWIHWSELRPTFHYPRFGSDGRQFFSA